MDSVAARRSMVEALEGMNRAIDAARNKISSSSYLSTFEELHVVFIRCRVEIKDAAVSLEAAVVAAEAATASRDATVIWDLGLRIRGLKGLAKVWRGRQEEERWGRCLERCNHGSTEEWHVLSLKRVAATACSYAEHLVAQIPDPWVSAAEAVEAATASRDASASRRPRVWRGRLEQRWRRCLKRCNHGSTEKWVLSLKRIAAMACRNAEKLVAWLREPRVSPELVDDAERTALLADELAGGRKGERCDGGLGGVSGDFEGDGAIVFFRRIEDLAVESTFCKSRRFCLL